MPDNRISLVILAGGKSSRMGVNKAELRYKENTFLEHQIQKGRNLGISDIWVSGYQGNIKDTTVSRVFDRFPEKGPLGGLESSLRQIKNEKCLVLGIDIVLVPLEELQNLIAYAAMSDSRAVILEHNGKQEPLIGIYDRSLADEMVTEISEYKGSVFAFLRRMRYDVYITACPDDVFLNINTPDTYRQLLDPKVLDQPE